MLSADIVLRDAATGETVKDVTLDFMQDVPEEGALATALRVDGLDSLRPGDYEGEIALEAQSPSGLPMDVRLRPAPEIPVSLSVPAPGGAACAARRWTSAMCCSIRRPISG